MEQNFTIKKPYLLELNVWQPHGPYIFNADCTKREKIIRDKDSWLMKKPSNL